MLFETKSRVQSSKVMCSPLFRAQMYTLNLNLAQDLKFELLIIKEK